MFKQGEGEGEGEDSDGEGGDEEDEDGFFVPHGYLSEGEGCESEEDEVGRNICVAIVCTHTCLLQSKITF